jgi:hypothetical protein
MINSTEGGVKTMHKGKNILAWIVTLTVLGSSLMTPAHAALVATAQVIVPSNGAIAERERILNWLAREDVARRLQDYGVRAADAQARVAAQVAQDRCRRELPAGGGRT